MLLCRVCSNNFRGKLITEIIINKRINRFRNDMKIKRCVGSSELFRKRFQYHHFEYENGCELVRYSDCRITKTCVTFWAIVIRKRCLPRPFYRVFAVQYAENCSRKSKNVPTLCQHRQRATRFTPKGIFTDEMTKKKNTHHCKMIEHFVVDCFTVFAKTQNTIKTQRNDGLSRTTRPSRRDNQNLFDRYRRKRDLVGETRREIRTYYIYHTHTRSPFFRTRARHSHYGRRQTIITFRNRNRRRSHTIYPIVTNTFSRTVRVLYSLDV